MSGDNWYVYMVRCADDSLYTGIAKDVVRRVEEHNGDSGLGAKYTRARRPVCLVYHEQAASRAEAAKRECQLKRLTRQRKLALIGRQNGSPVNPSPKGCEHG